jgi:hypothetical protein
MIIENNFKLFSILLIMGVLNEKRCKNNLVEKIFRDI